LAAVLVAGCTAGAGTTNAVTSKPSSAVADAPLARPAPPPGFTDGFREANGVKLHYVIGGSGSPVEIRGQSPPEPQGSKRRMDEADQIADTRGHGEQQA
jgi:hypothetical protein